jgi:glucose dehydrogenase
LLILNHVFGIWRANFNWWFVTPRNSLREPFFMSSFSLTMLKTHAAVP